MAVSHALRSPLALVILALLCEHPMHVYGLQKLIRERGQEKLVNVEHRNSVRQAIDRLGRDGCVEIDQVLAGGAGPRRTVYRVTAAGRELLSSWLRESLASPRPEYPVFPVAVSLMAFLTPGEVSDLLVRRRAALHGDLSALVQQTESADLPRVFLLENDFVVAMLEAEISWIDEIRARIVSAELSWDTSQLLDASTMGATLTDPGTTPE